MEVLELLGEGEEKNREVERETIRCEKIHRSVCISLFILISFLPSIRLSFLPLPPSLTPRYSPFRPPSRRLFTLSSLLPPRLHGDRGVKIRICRGIGRDEVNQGVGLRDMSNAHL